MTELNKPVDRQKRREILDFGNGFAINMSNYRTLRSAVYDAVIDQERAEAYQEGYNDALRNIEQLAHDFRTGIRC